MYLIILLEFLLGLHIHCDQLKLDCDVTFTENNTCMMNRDIEVYENTDLQLIK